MLEIRLLGQFDVKRAGKPVEIASRPSRVLFAYLALSAGKHHPRERLSALLWPDSDPANARGNLRQALWRLRKAIGEEFLRVDNETVAFDATADYWLDTKTLQGEDGQDLAQVVALYEGELLPGYYEEWVLLERGRLQAAFEAKMQRLIDSLEQQQQWAELLHWAEHWIAFGQTPEAAYRALMTAHAAQGDMAALSAAFQRCVTILNQEIGVEPSAETRELYEHLLQGQLPTLKPLAKSDGGFVKQAPRSNLPQQATPLIGRQKELAQIRERLAGTRLLTLVGPGGTGKTRLALQTATEMASAFRNGAFLVSLAPIKSPDLIAQTIAESIGFPLSSEEDPDEQLLRHLRRRQYLLVLDNFEHLLTGAPLISQILQQAAQVKIVATSRERLNLQEEMIYRIDGLAYPETDSPSEPMSYDAVQLFLASAQRLQPDIVTDDDDMAYIVHICRLLEGMPLAILLAAAWVESFTLEEIVTEIAQSLDFLQAEWRNVPGRHHSVRAAFDPSWQRLSEGQRQRFAALGVFIGGFTKEAAASVAKASVKDLAHLVNKSLVRRNLATGRFDLHELLRQYAKERSAQDPDAEEAAVRAHAVYFAEFIEKQWLKLISREQQTALAAIDAELDNLRQSWRYWLEQGNGRRIRMYFYSFWRVYELHSWSRTGMELFREAVAALQPRLATADEETEVAYAELLAGQAHFMANLGYTDDGRRLALESVAILRRQGRFHELGMPFITLRYNTTYTEESPKTLEIDLSEAEFSDDLDGQWKQAYVSTFEGRKFGWDGDVELAREQIAESRRQFESMGDRLSTAWSWLELGHLAILTGAYDEARDAFERALGIANAFDYHWAMVKANRYLGNVGVIVGQFRVAKNHLLASLQLADELGMIRDVISALYDLALVEATTEDKRGDAPKEMAVRLLTLVRQHPLSNQTRTLSLFTQEPKVRFQELAGMHLARLQEELPADVYATASAAGRDMDLDTAVLELLAGNDR